MTKFMSVFTVSWIFPHYTKRVKNILEERFFKLLLPNTIISFVFWLSPYACNLTSTHATVLSSTHHSRFWFRICHSRWAHYLIVLILLSKSIQFLLSFLFQYFFMSDDLQIEESRFLFLELVISILIFNLQLWQVRLGQILQLHDSLIIKLLFLFNLLF